MFQVENVHQIISLILQKIQRIEKDQEDKQKDYGIEHLNY